MSQTLLLLLQIGLLVALMAFGTACATSYGASTRGEEEIPPAPAGATYQKWDHLCLILGQSTVSEKLNKAGEEGWELVVFEGSLACFKRPAASSL